MPSCAKSQTRETISLFGGVALRLLVSYYWPLHDARASARAHTHTHEPILRSECSCMKRAKNYEIKAASTREDTTTTATTAIRARAR